MSASHDASVEQLRALLLGNHPYGRSGAPEPELLIQLISFLPAWKIESVAEIAMTLPPGPVRTSIFSLLHDRHDDLSPSVIERLENAVQLSDKDRDALLQGAGPSDHRVVNPLVVPEPRFHMLMEGLPQQDRVRLATEVVDLLHSELVGEQRPHSDRFISRGAEDAEEAEVEPLDETLADAASVREVTTKPPQATVPKDQIEAYEDAESMGPEAKSERFVNIAIYQKDRQSPVESIAPRHRLFLRIDMGEQSKESIVSSPQPFPEEVLPPGDQLIEVMVSSADFRIGTKWKNLSRNRASHGAFLLPRDRSRPAVAVGQRRRFLYFTLEAPQRAGKAKARIGLYFRDALVQSFVLIADVGEAGHNFSVTTDFTVATTLQALGAIPQRPRVSVMINRNSDGAHQVTYRFPRKAAEADGRSFDVSREDGHLARDLRKALVGRAPTQVRRTKRDLVQDLRQLAPLGWKLNAAFSAGLEDVLIPADEAGNVILSISRPRTSTYTLPWSLVYDIPLDSSSMERPDRIDICPLVDEWDERRDLVDGLPWECPRREEVSHDRDLLCPFGLWGYRFSIEVLVSSDKPVTNIHLPATSRVAAVLTQYNVNTTRLDDHIAELDGILRPAIGSDLIGRAIDKSTAEQLLGNELSLVYFYCHGEKSSPQSPDTYLGIGRREALTPADFLLWVRGWMRRGNGRRPWEQTRPLVFVNACHSLEINPETVSTYVDAFVMSGHAAGVIGTEVMVEQELAMQMARRFVEVFARQDEVGTRPSVAEALRRARLAFLAKGNLFGLAYTPYCWADLSLTSAVPGRTEQGDRPQP